MKLSSNSRKFISFVVKLAALCPSVALFGATPVCAQETVGDGALSAPAVGPAPSYGIAGSGMVLVKNWRFGTTGTIRNLSEMNAAFQYHDQFNTFNNGGGNYGANIAAPDAANALPGQPIEGSNCPRVRSFTADSLITSLSPYFGVTTVIPAQHHLCSGSFQAKWNLPNGGTLLGHDIVWETRVRYVIPPYFWFAIWSAGSKWNKGAEMDVIESFGFDNGGGFTNFDGRYWHSNSVGGSDADLYSSWPNSMNAHLIHDYDATQYHIWTWYYEKNDNYHIYVDGVLVQNGTIHWTLAGEEHGAPIDLDFIFDASWAHTKLPSVDHPLPASAFDGKFYEWSYSRVYLR
jgi:hypothetical protein